MITYWFSLIGVAVFAASGSLAAAKKGFDLIGVLAISVITALGGGTLRDILIGNYPILWIADTLYLWIAIIGAAVTVGYVRFYTPPHKFLLFGDALGLALFSISGAQVAEQHGFSPIIIVIMGALTGVAGGVARDLLTSEVPLLFRSRETLYATPTILGISMYLGLEANNISQPIAAIIGMSCIALIRLAAISWDLTLPAFRVREAPAKR